MQKITFPRASLWLIGLMFVLPFLIAHHQLPIASFYNEWLAAALGLAALMLMVRKRVWEDMKFPAVALVPLGLIVLLMLQIMTVKIVTPERSLLAASYLLWATLLMMLGNVLRRELGWEEVVGTLAWFLLLGGVLNAGIAILQHYKVSSVLDPLILKSTHTVFANMGQPNHFSNYIALSIASLIYLRIKQGLHLIALFPLLTLLLFVLSFSGSRSSWLYVVAFTVLSLWFYFKGEGRKFGGLAKIAVVLIPGFALAQFAAHALSISISTPTENFFALAGAKSDRLALWSEAWGMFLDSPLLGVGFGEFAGQHFLRSPYLPEEVRGGLYNHAHNIVLQLLAELGVLAVIFLVVGVTAWFLAVKKKMGEPEQWWLFSLLAVLAIHSMLEFPLWYTYFLGIAAILLGAGELRMFNLSMRKIGKWLSMALLLLGCVSLANLAQSYASLEGVLDKQSRLELSESKIQEFVETFTRIHRESLLTSYVELAFTRGITLNRDNVANKLALNGRVMHFAPINEIVYRQAILLGLNGEHQAAAKQFDLAMLAYPKDVVDVVGLLRRKFKDDEAGFGPLLVHVESRLRGMSAYSAGR